MERIMRTFTADVVCTLHLLDAPPSTSIIIFITITINIALHRCRYATAVPMSKQSLGKLKYTVSSLRNALYAKRRPHYVFGSKEFREQARPLCLPPLPPAFFAEEAPPAEGLLSRPQDLRKIEQLVRELKPFLSPAKLGYEGKKNALGQLHGKGEGRVRDSSLSLLGSVYYAGAVIYIPHNTLCTVNLGSFRFSSGNKYDGSYKNNKRDGYGKFVFANGKPCPALPCPARLARAHV
jgi:hypothetical protein